MISPLFSHVSVLTDPFATLLTRTCCAEIAHNISTRKRKEIVERAAQHDVVVTNKPARLCSQEDE